MCHFNIMSIDPGSNLGISILHVDSNLLTINNINPMTILRDIKIYNDPNVCSASDRYTRLKRQYEIITSLLYQHRPSYIVSEAPFYNPRMPNAFSALVEVMHVIRTAVNDFDPYLTLDTIDPSSVKKCIGANGISSKDAVKLALLQHTELYPLVHDIFNYLDEHAIDSIAVGYCLLSRIRGAGNVKPNQISGHWS